MASALAGLAPTVLAAKSRHPRSLSPGALAALFQKHGLTTAEFESTSDALRKAEGMAQKRDLILVTGSLFIAAEAREHFRGIQGEVYPELRPITSPEKASPTD